MTQENLALLRLSLEHLDLADRGRRQLRREGLTTPEGRKHPALDAIKLSDGFYLRGLRQLGLDVVQKSERG